MATKLQKVTRRIWLHRKVEFLNNSDFYEDIELKVAMKTNFFGSLSSKGNILLQFDVIIKS